MNWNITKRDAKTGTWSPDSPATFSGDQASVDKYVAGKNDAAHAAATKKKAGSEPDYEYRAERA